MNGLQPAGPADELSFGFDFARCIKDARESRLGLGLILASWFHLLVFASCEILYLRGDRAATHFLPLWSLDVGFAVLVIRQRIAAMASLGSARSARVSVRIWLTFSILCLTSASLNTITGFQVDWFKISWAMLGTFGFAMLAWIFHIAFLAPAVWMSVTALMIAAHPDHAYAIFGVSWCVVLNSLGLLLEGKRIAQRIGIGGHRRERFVIRRRSQEV